MKRKRVKEDGVLSFSRAAKVVRTEIFSFGNHVDYLSFNQNKDVLELNDNGLEFMYNLDSTLVKISDIFIGRNKKYYF